MIFGKGAIGIQRASGACVLGSVKWKHGPGIVGGRGGGEPVLNQLMGESRVWDFFKEEVTTVAGRSVALNTAGVFKLGRYSPVFYISSEVLFNGITYLYFIICMKQVYLISISLLRVNCFVLL